MSSSFSPTAACNPTCGFSSTGAPRSACPSCSSRTRSDGSSVRPCTPRWIAAAVRPGLFASHGTTLILIESLVLAVAAGNRADAEESLATLNDLRAALAGRRLDVDPR